jgi:hypothetical protein
MYRRGKSGTMVRMPWEDMRMYLEYILPLLFAVWIGCFFFCETCAAKKEAKQQKEREADRAKRQQQMLGQRSV